MDIQQMKGHKLKTILQFSIPSIIAMLLETVITITDGYFTGRYVGENALAAINLGLPVLYLYLGAGLCIGVGGSAVYSRLLGAGEQKRASEVFSQTMVTATLVCVALSVCVFAFFTPILGFLKADGALGAYFTDYYKIMLFAYPLMVIRNVSGMAIRSAGQPQICMLVGILNCILNALLDYAFTGKMQLGVYGSALATLIGQAVAVLIHMLFFLRTASVLRFRRFSFDHSVNREIMLNGSSEFIGEMASAICMFAFNYVLLKYVGTEGVAAFTILGFAVYGYSMICIGFGQGIAPLVSICRGAGENRTALELRTVTNRILFVTGALFAVIFAVFGRSFAGIFGCSREVMDMVAEGFLLYVETFLFMGYNVINSMYFTSCGDAKSSALISSLRGIVLLLGFGLTLPVIFGMTGVWLSAPFSETLTAAVSVVLIGRQKKREVVIYAAEEN